MLQFILARVALGLAESAAYPGAVKSVAEWFPRRERALGVGILNAGANVGVLLTPIVGIMIAGMLWLARGVPRHRPARLDGLRGLAADFRLPEDHPHVTDQERAYIEQDGEDPDCKPLGWAAALRQRQAWFFICGKFFTDPVWYLFLFWLPDFFSKTQRMTLFPTGEGGMLVDHRPGADRGLPARRHRFDRRWLAVVAPDQARLERQPRAQDHAVHRRALRAAAGQRGEHRQAGVVVLLIGLGTAGHRRSSSNIFTMISDMYPRRAVATVAGMGGAAGAVGGILIAQATGWTLQLTGSYVPIVLYAGIAYLFAFAAIHCWCRGWNRRRWKRHELGDHPPPGARRADRRGAARWLRRAPACRCAPSRRSLALAQCARRRIRAPVRQRNRLGAESAARSTIRPMPRS